MAQPFAIYHNECRYVVEFEFDLSAGAAVTATRGTDIAVVKTGTGAYTATIKGVKAIKVVELLRRDANYTGGVPATALGVRVATVTQTEGTDDVIITVNTTASPTSGANTDGTAVTTVSVNLVIRSCRLGSPL